MRLKALEEEAKKPKKSGSRQVIPLRVLCRGKTQRLPLLFPRNMPDGIQVPSGI